MFTRGIALSASGAARPVFVVVALPELMRRKHLLERHEARRLGGTDTGATVRDGLVGDGELAEVVANHLRLQREQPTTVRHHC